MIISYDIGMVITLTLTKYFFETSELSETSTNKYKQVAWLHQSERTTSSHFNHTEIDASMMLINMGFFSGLFINSRYSLTPGLGILIKMQTRLAGFRLITEGKLHDIFYHCFL